MSPQLLNSLHANTKKAYNKTKLARQAREHEIWTVHKTHSGPKRQIIRTKIICENNIQHETD